MTRPLLFTFVVCAAIASPAYADLPKPRGITLEMPLEHARASGGVQTLVGRPRSIAFAGPGQPPLPIFLNRNGGTYRPGNDDSRANTSIVPNSPSTVTPFRGSAAQWQAVVSCVTTMFAPFNVQIVETEPARGEYVEAVIGGSPDQVGLPRGVGGVAPIDSFQCNIIPNAIVFAFSDVYANDPQDTCETAAQEIAHAISLDHELHCPDPMTYLSGCGAKAFRDLDAQCGEFQARACNCGRSRQNSVQVLIEKLGASNGMVVPPPPGDMTAPTINVTAPTDPATMNGDQVITISADIRDNNAVAATELVWLYTQAVWPCPANLNGGSVVCTRSGNISTWRVNVGQGDRRYKIRARDNSGNQFETPERVIHLGMTGPPPPTDTTPPVAAITSPADGAQLPAMTTIQIVAHATDTNGLGSIELVWSQGTDAFPCPFTSQGVNCAKNGDDYTWSLNVGVGTRRFAVRAIDPAGNSFTTPERGVMLVTGTTMPPPMGADTVAEDNDSAAEAFPTRCGNAIDLVVTRLDEDWFAYDTPAGTDIELGITAMAGVPIAAELYDVDGRTMIAGVPDVVVAGGTIHATSVGARVLARITTSAASASYRLSATCTAGAVPVSPDGGVRTSTNPPGGGGGGNIVRGGCSTGGTPGEGGAWMVLMGLALLAVRRNR